MEQLDYVEDQAKRLAAFSLETRDQLLKRIYALLTFLLAVSGGLGAWALARLEKGMSPEVMGAGALALCLFSVAVWLVFVGYVTKPLRPPSNSPGILLSYLEARSQEGKDAGMALEEARRAELLSLDKRLSDYRDRNNQMADTVDRGYKATIAAAGVGFVVWAVALFALR